MLREKYEEKGSEKMKKNENKNNNNVKKNEKEKKWLKMKQGEFWQKVIPLFLILNELNQFP